MKPLFTLSGKMESRDRKLLFWLVIINIIFWTAVFVLP